MTPLSTQLDKAAIGLSLFCAVHCLLLPVALVILPTIAATTFGEERFHQWMLVAVLPVSMLALTLGCRQHRQLSVAILGFGGLLTLIIVALFGHDLVGEVGEKTLSVLGAALLASSHFRNHRLCQKRRCPCEHH